MMVPTRCPICDEVLTVDLFPEFLSCGDCGVGVKRVECLKSPEQVQANFDTAWANKHGNDLTAKLAARSIVKRIKGLGQIRDILDVGCGSGVLVDMLGDEGYDSTGLDMSAEVINYARLHKRGRYLCATVDEVRRKYDVVVMSHLLEHIEKPVEYLRRVANLVKPFGFLLVLVPNLEGYDSESIWRSESHITLFDHTHITAFSQKGLTLLLKKVGYGTQKINTQTLGATSLKWLVIGLYHRLWKKPALYTKQGFTSKAKPDRMPSIYEAIMESKLARCLSYIPNRLSERRGKGKDLVVLATISGED